MVKTTQRKRERETKMEGWRVNSTRQTNQNTAETAAKTSSMLAGLNPSDASPDTKNAIISHVSAKGHLNPSLSCRVAESLTC